MDDIVEMGSQPTCPECESVLYDAGNGYQCRSCRLVFLPNVDPPR